MFEIGIDLDSEDIIYNNYNKEECFLLTTFLFCLMWKYANQKGKDGKKFALDLLDYVKSDLEKKTNHDIEQLFSKTKIVGQNKKKVDLSYIG